MLLFQAELDCSESTCDDGSRYDVFLTKVSSSFVNVTILEKCENGGFSGLREIRALTMKPDGKGFNISFMTCFTTC